MMAGVLAGTKAIITGAGRGIGTEIARLFAAEGASVVLTYRASRSDADALQESIRAAGGTAFSLQADLNKTEDVSRLVSESTRLLDGLNALINNASGFGKPELLIDATWEAIDTEWQAVVQPTVLLTRAVLPHFIAGQQGRIVNLVATLVERPAASFGAHTMAKAAVLAYTRTLAREVGSNNITVNAVSPGTTLTEFSMSLSEELKRDIAAKTPLRRLATPADVAGAVLFFCSPYADFITGANIAPDGGLAVL